MLAQPGACVQPVVLDLVVRIGVWYPRACTFEHLNQFEGEPMSCPCDPIYLRDDAPPEQRVSRLYAWIAIQADGGEGIIGHVLPGLGMTPLVTSKLSVAVSLRLAAKQALVLSGHPAVELRVFGSPETLDRLERA